MIGYKPEHQRGFALLIAVVLSAIAALITVSVTTLAYKSLLLSSDAQNSEYAFYAADSAIECALYWDSGQRNNGNPLFPYSQTPTAPTGVSCPLSGVAQLTFTAGLYNGRTSTTSYISNWFDISDGNTGCAQISVYKDKNGHGGLFADATNVACAASTSNPRAVERGLRALY